jgi:hypothetical protein
MLGAPRMACRAAGADRGAGGLIDMEGRASGHGMGPRTGLASRCGWAPSPLVGEAAALLETLSATVGGRTRESRASPARKPQARRCVAFTPGTKTRLPVLLPPASRGHRGCHLSRTYRDWPERVNGAINTVPTRRTRPSGGTKLALLLVARACGPRKCAVIARTLWLWPATAPSALWTSSAIGCLPR